MKRMLRRCFWAASNPLLRKYVNRNMHSGASTLRQRDPGGIGRSGGCKGKFSVNPFGSFSLFPISLSVQRPAEPWAAIEDGAKSAKRTYRTKHRAIIGAYL